MYQKITKTKKSLKENNDTPKENSEKTQTNQNNKVQKRKSV